MQINIFCSGDKHFIIRAIDIKLMQLFTSAFELRISTPNAIWSIVGKFRIHVYPVINLPIMYAGLRLSNFADNCPNNNMRVSLIGSVNASSVNLVSYFDLSISIDFTSFTICLATMDTDVSMLSSSLSFTGLSNLEPYF